MEECIFCRIIKGEIPCYKVYEDEDVLAFLDINPITPGHTLIIPKKHGIMVIDYTDEELGKLLPVAKKVMWALRKSVAPGGFNILSNNGREAGQGVEHLHIHIIPRTVGDGKERALAEFFSSRKLPDEEMKVIQENIVKNMGIK